MTAVHLFLVYGSTDANIAYKATESGIRFSDSTEALSLIASKHRDIEFWRKAKRLLFEEFW